MPKHVPGPRPVAFRGNGGLRNFEANRAHASKSKPVGNPYREVASKIGNASCEENEEPNPRTDGRAGEKEMTDY
jgi:hypothetical protein